MERKQCFSVQYGFKDRFANVTLHALTRCCVSDASVLVLPACDVQRAQLLTDPLFGVVKTVHIHDADGDLEFNHTQEVTLPLDPNDIFVQALLNLERAHAIFHLKKSRETSVQQMLCMLFVDPKSSVAQIRSPDGGNLAFCLAHLLNDPKAQLFVLEQDKKQLDQIRQLQQCNERNPKAFFNETSDSYVRLMESTFVDALVIQGRDTIWELFSSGQPDCLLATITTLILTNDYTQERHHDLVSDKLQNLGFNCLYFHAEANNLRFYEVWVRPRPRKVKPSTTDDIVQLHI